MRKHKHVKGNIRLRKTLILEAARLIYEEGVSQYHTAKWRATKRILARGGSKAGRIRSRDLPSNGEISSALYELAQLHEGELLTTRLFSMRVSALDLMAELQQFSPRLIGSVSTGRIKKSSDIDLHVFTDNIETLERYLDSLEWPYDKNEVTRNHHGKLKDFTHIYLAHEYPVELSIYPRMDLRVRTRSSTDGKPIIRFSYEKLLTLIEQEHSDAWTNYLAYGE